MRMREVLMEMPIVSTHPIFNEFRNEQRNTEEYERLMAIPNLKSLPLPSRCRQNSEFILYAGKDFYFLIANRERYVYYFMAFETGVDATLGSYATQIKVWRRADAPRGIASGMFIEVLLPHFGSMVSDGIQSESGFDFWIAIMREALDIDCYVGAVVDNVYEPYAGNLANWAHGSRVWRSETKSDHEKYMFRRAVISQKNIPAGSIIHLKGN